MKNFVKITFRKSRNSLISNLKSSSCVKFKFCRKHSKSFYSQENLFKKVFQSHSLEIMRHIEKCYFENRHFGKQATSKVSTWENMSLRSAFSEVLNFRCDRFTKLVNLCRNRFRSDSFYEMANFRSDRLRSYSFYVMTNF